jgi:hypothetical protein
MTRPTATGGEQQRLLHHWGLQSASGGRLRPPDSRPPKGAVVGEALLLTARELRLVLTLLLVMFMTGEAWRYVGALSRPRLVVLIAGPFLAAFGLIGVGLSRQLRAAETVLVPGTGAGDPPRAVMAPRAAYRRLLARVRARVWLETLLVSTAVAGLFGFLGLATVDADLTREWSGQNSIQVLRSVTILGEELVLSAALVQVAAFLGALAALSFAVEVVADEESRRELTDDLLDAYNRAVTIWSRHSSAA